MTRTQHIQIRVSPNEKAQIQRAAELAGLPVSEFLRQLAVASGN